MAEDTPVTDENLTQPEPGPKAPAEDLDLDEDVASALAQEAPSNASDKPVDVDAALSEVDPDFKDKLPNIKNEDFAGVVIPEDDATHKDTDGAKAPSLYKTYWNNLPRNRKQRYWVSLAILLAAVTLVVFIGKGYLLPRFEVPYILSMNELSDGVHSYPAEESMVPLFDDYRTKSFTHTLPKIMISLKQVDGRASFAEIEFFLNLREEEAQTIVQSKQTEIIDRIQRILEQVTVQELEDPSGKDRVKQLLRQGINDLLQGSYVVGVYYRTILLKK